MNRIFLQTIPFINTHSHEVSVRKSSTHRRGAHESRERHPKAPEFAVLLMASAGFFSALTPHIMGVTETLEVDFAHDLPLLRKSPTFRFTTSLSFGAVEQLQLLDDGDGDNALSILADIISEIDVVRHLTLNVWFDSDDEYDDGETKAATLKSIIDSLPWLVTCHLVPTPEANPFLWHLLRHKRESVRRYACRQLRDAVQDNFHVDGNIRLFTEHLLPLLDRPVDNDAEKIDYLDAVRQVLFHVSRSCMPSAMLALCDRFLAILEDERNRTPVKHSAAACLHTLVVTSISRCYFDTQVALHRSVRSAMLLDRLVPVLQSIATHTVPLVAQYLNAATQEQELLRRKKEERSQRLLALLEEAREKERKKKKKSARNEMTMSDIFYDSDEDHDVYFPVDLMDDGVEYKVKHDHEARAVYHVDLEVRFVFNVLTTLAWQMHMLPVGSDKLQQLEQKQPDGNIIDSLLSILDNSSFFEYMQVRSASSPASSSLDHAWRGIRASIYRILSHFVAAAPDAMLRRGAPQKALSFCRAWHNSFQACRTAAAHSGKPLDYDVREQSTQPPPHWAQVAPALSVVTALMFVPTRRVELVPGLNVTTKSSRKQQQQSDGSDIVGDTAKDDNSDAGNVEKEEENNNNSDYLLHHGNRTDRDYVVLKLDILALELPGEERRAHEANVLLLFGRGRNDFNIEPLLLSFFTSFSGDATLGSDDLLCAPFLSTVLTKASTQYSINRQEVATALKSSAALAIVHHFAFALRTERTNGEEDGSVKQDTTNTNNNNNNSKNADASVLSSSRRRARDDIGFSVPRFAVHPGALRPVARFFIRHEDGVFAQLQSLFEPYSYAGMRPKVLEPTAAALVRAVQWKKEPQDTDDYRYGTYCHGCGCYH